jgi:uncharacterized protein (TIGR03437 family)
LIEMPREETRMRKLLLFPFLIAKLFAQAPVITDVITFDLHDHNFAPGSAVIVLGTFVHGAGRDFSINVGSASTQINVAANTVFLTATIPINAPTGSQPLTISYLGQVSNALTINVSPLAPEISGAGVGILGNNAPPSYNPYNPFSDANTNTRITPTNPALPGEPLSVQVYGLGSNTIPTVTPTISIGGQNVSIAQSQVGSGRETLYFFVPQGAAGILPVIITFAGVASNTVYLPVGTAPAIQAIANSASFAPAGTVAPGSFATILAANLGSNDNLSAFPSTAVNGDSVLFGSTPAPIFALVTGPGVINVYVPSELPTSGTVNVTVKTAAGTSAPVTLNLAPAVPGMFSFIDPLRASRRNGAILVANTAWIAMPLTMAAAMGLPSNCDTLGAATLCGRPAHRGDNLVIYATGLGLATPNADPNGSPIATGSVAPANANPLYKTVATPVVTIGGMAAQVQFSGIVPGYAGFYQINVQIPSNAPLGDDVPVQLSMPGSTSDTTTIAIGQ